MVHAHAKPGAGGYGMQGRQSFTDRLQTSPRHFHISLQDKVTRAAVVVHRALRQVTQQAVVVLQTVAHMAADGRV